MSKPQPPQPSRTLERPEPSSDSVPATERIVSLREVSRVMGMSRATIYRRIRAGLFPRPVIVAPHRVGWVEREVLAAAGKPFVRQ
jgi:prophage regulatory protein